MRVLGMALAAVLCLAAPGWGEECTPGAEPNPKILMETVYGDMLIELCIEDAPESVANFLDYLDDGSYDDDIFIHRSPETLPVIQGGGFYVDDSVPGVMRAVETKDPISLEATGLSNERGTIAMARRIPGQGEDPRTPTTTSQWYINIVDNPGLDPPDPTDPEPTMGFAVFGVVLLGMEGDYDPDDPDPASPADQIWRLGRCALNPPLTELPRMNDHPCGSASLFDHLVYVAVPEPGLAAQLAAGVALLGALGRRRGRPAARPS